MTVVHYRESTDGVRTPMCKRDGNDAAYRCVPTGDLMCAEHVRTLVQVLGYDPALFIALGPSDLACV